MKLKHKSRKLKQIFFIKIIKAVFFYIIGSRKRVLINEAKHKNSTNSIKKFKLKNFH